MQFTDEWLVPSIETLLSDEADKALRQEPGPDASLWDILVDRKLATDEQILGAVASRFRLPVAELSKADPKLTTTGPEQLAPRVQLGPGGPTPSLFSEAKPK